ncbi:MFS transporter [Phenylobacterium sp.]|uniref:MFS transporter n=1 Tax=Phenylobacterium sp. TaxID=1871053 RepID=UPI002CAD601E|nr:MFS transporter [Phenylobacterium sp.]HVI33479.1 MFS transporter [Phenylobacterium sp.]
MTAKVRLFLMMVLQLAVWGAWAPKLFPYMGMLGFEPWQQSLVGSSWGVAALLGIFFSNQFADRNFSAERFLAVSHLLGGLALVFTAFATEFWPFFAGYLVYSLLYVPTLSVSNSIAFANLDDPAKDFGAVRMGGTIGWMLVSWPFVFLLGAQATPEQVRWIFLVAAIVSFALAAYSLTLPHTPPKKDAAGADPLAWREAIKLLGVPFVAVLFVVTFIDSVIHNGYFVMADAFLTQRVGIAGNLSMLVLSLGQLAEILTMFVLGGVLIRLGWKATMIIGILGHAARFSVFAFFADSVPVIIAVQLLHGVCYAFFFATVYIFVDAVFPKDVRSSAQGLFNLLILGVGAVAASFLFPSLMGRMTLPSPDGGPPQVDYQSLFMVPTGMALVAVVLLALFFRPPEKRPVHPVAP